MKLATRKASLSIAAAMSALLTSTVVNAADVKTNGTDAAPPSATTRSPLDYSDRAQMKAWSAGKEQLERELSLRQNKAFYVKALGDRGFQITSINTDKPDAVEYEVVKGHETYEVQIDFDAAGKSTKVDVTTNAWRSDATKAAMKGDKVPVAARFERGNESYSERARMKTWSGEKDRLEKSLAPGHDKDYYSRQLKTMGYQITSVNDNEKDYVEYEIVKGGDSFEVQIEFAGGKAKDVDVTTNVWQSDATQRALLAAKQR